MGYWLNNYECGWCGKHHQNGSKAQARCEAQARKPIGDLEATE